MYFLLVVPALLLTKASFDMMTDAFNNAIAKEAKYQDVHLYADTGSSYTREYGIRFYCLVYLIPFASCIGRYYHSLSRLFGTICADHPPP